MASVMYRVTGVPNGDQFVVVPASSTAWDAEKKTIGISSIKCPKLSRPGREEEGGIPIPDDPFAWEARELARKATIGKTIKFVKESHIDQLNRDIGEIYFQKDGQPANLGVELVAAGFANISDRVTKSTAYTKALAGAALEAMEGARGMHSADPSGHIRDVNHFATSDILDKLAKKKGTKMQAVIEAVFSGHALKACLLPSFQIVTIQLTGVVCEKKPGQEDTGINAPSKADKELWEQLYHKEKAFTEKCLLHREVTLILEGTKFDNVLATVVKGSDGVFQEELLKLGFAKLFDQTAAAATHRDRLVEAEKKAKEGRVGRWKNLQATTKVVSGGKAEEKAAPKLADEFQGIVLQVSSPDTVIVLNEATGEEVRVQLASIRGGGSTDQDSFRPPKEGDAGPRGQSSSASTFAKMEKQGDVIMYRNLYLEGRAFVCKEVLGKKVTVKPDYMSQVPQGVDKFDTRLNATVYYDDGKNIATEIVRQGLAVPMSGKERSRDAFLYSDAFDEAKAAKRGLHGGKRGEHKVQDMAKPDEKKGKAMLAYLQRSGIGGAGVPKLKGFVEYVLAPNRFKIYIERENVQISLNLAGIVCPSNNAPFGGETRKDDPDPCEKEATTFAKRLALQREVEVQVEHFHKGTYVGNVYINGKSAAVSMLEEGLATMLGQNLSSMSCRSDAEAAETAAKSSKKGIWAPEAGMPRRAMASVELQEKRATGKTVFSIGDNKQVPCTVTEIIDSVHFYFQTKENKENMKKVEHILHAAVLNDVPAPSDKDLKNGDMVAARFSGDKTWYRARLTKVHGNGKVDLFYTDYGNRELLPVSEIRKVASVADSFRTLPPQANEGWLAFMHHLGIDEAGAEEGAQSFCDFIEGRDVTVAHEYSEGKQKFYTVRWDKKPLQNHLIVNGLGLVSLAVADNVLLSKPVGLLQKSEALARKEKRGMWKVIRGDPRSYDDDY